MSQMNLHNFLGRVRSLYNVDGFLLADALSLDDQRSFVLDPVTYFMNTDYRQQKAIWREVQNRAEKWDHDEEAAS